MIIVLKTNKGDISLALDFEKTPLTAQNFLDYAKSGFYDGLIFHRVIKDFMIQGGGFDKDMERREPNDPIENEAHLGDNNLKGTIAMARTSQPHSASSQFFINVKNNSSLDHRSKTGSGWGYCVFGKVVSGMDVVMDISLLPTTGRDGHENVPQENVVIEKVVIENDDVVTK